MDFDREDDSYGVTEEDIKALEDERAMLSESFEDQGKRLIKEALPSAIRSIVELAERGGTDTVRLRAAQYIIDRNLGPVTSGGGEYEKAPWERTLERVTTTIPAKTKE